MKLKIATPEGIAFEKENIKSITVPTIAGIITILEDHMPLISTLAPGEIEVVFEEDGRSEYLAVSKGVVEIKRDQSINIMAETAEYGETIDLERAEEARKKAEEFMQKAEQLENVEFAMLQAKIEKELARINVSKRYRK